MVTEIKLFESTNTQTLTMAIKKEELLFSLILI